MKNKYVEYLYLFLNTIAILIIFWQTFSPIQNFLLKSALNTANYIIIPVQSEIWSIESFNILINIINDITRHREKNIIFLL